MFLNIAHMTYDTKGVYLAHASYSRDVHLGVGVIFHCCLTEEQIDLVIVPLWIRFSLPYVGHVDKIWFLNDKQKHIFQLLSPSCQC